MRKSRQTVAEIEAADKAADDRKSSRSRGFSLMDIRDRGWARLETGQAILWHVDTDLADNEVRDYVPKGKLKLVTDKQILMLDADELGRYQRWA